MPSQYNQAEDSRQQGIRIQQQGESALEVAVRTDRETAQHIAQRHS